VPSDPTGTRTRADGTRNPGDRHVKFNTAYDGDDLREKDRRHTVHGWTDYSQFLQDGPEILVEGDGVHVTDLYGNRLMDAMAGVWCVNVGYGRTEIVDAIAAQARRLPFANPFRATSSPPAAELSAKLAELAPADLDHVLFSGGGSTANDAALRIVQRYFNTLGLVDKKGVVSRRNAYHGSTSASATLGGIDTIKAGFDVSASGVHYLSAPYAYREADGAGPDAYCDRLVDEFSQTVERVGAERIGCFIAEPVMGMGGVLIPPPGYFKRISEICKANDILIVADEVVTGFGRLGEFLASDAVFEMSPDIISCAKGLTSGYLPLGATIVSSRIMEVLSGPVAESETFTHGFTYAEHPVCCAAALANIEILEREGICRHVREMSAHFKESLETLLDFDIVGDVRGAGFMFAIENVADKETRSLFPPEVEIGHRIACHARRLGLIVRPGGHLNIFSPPLTMTRADVEFLTDTLRRSVRSTLDDLIREGLWRG